MSRTLKFFMILSVGILGPAWSSPSFALHQIQNIRHWVAPDHTRVVIDITGDVRFSVEKEDRKIAVDLEETAVPSGIPPLTVLNKPGVEGVAVSPRPNSGVRVELHLPGQVQTTVFKLKSFQEKPYRIVIDIVLPDVARQESEAREQVKVTRKDRIVVIDPGHGGEAVGAVGRGGAYEKDVVLAIGRKLRSTLNGRSGYRAFLTRDGDYYVSFKKRLMIAREYGADIFVSVHADAAKNRLAGGSSVYCLSTGGASSAAAKILARNENLADVVGGVPSGEGGEASDPIILDMFQTRAINQSKTFGGGLLHHLEGANRLKFTTVQEAPFLVLKLPDIPSVLIETAYISNPKEEKLLRSDRFQTRIAEIVARSVVEFLPPLPPVAVPESGSKDTQRQRQIQVIGDFGLPTGDVGVKKEDAGQSAKNVPAPAVGRPSPGKIAKEAPAREKGSLYRIKKGDTLQGIARRHGTSVAILLKLNRMKLRDPLYVNRMLKIAGGTAEAADEKRSDASAKRPPVKKAGQVIYRVKRGDTLARIARRYGTTVRILVELNHLTPDDPLFVDRKLILPGNSSL
jgi:N-acetylmuramoyl-L-alanine amidase